MDFMLLIYRLTKLPNRKIKIVLFALFLMLGLHLKNNWYGNSQTSVERMDQTQFIFPGVEIQNEPHATRKYAPLIEVKDPFDNLDETADYKLEQFLKENERDEKGMKFIAEGETFISGVLNVTNGKNKNNASTVKNEVKRLQSSDISPITYDKNFSDQNLAVSALVTSRRSSIHQETSGNDASNSKQKYQNFSYMINNVDICTSVKNLTYLIYVHSSPKNAVKRHVLRNSWAKNSVIPNYKSRIIFMLGNPHDDHIQKDLYNENKLYADIIQEDYTDSYKNLTLKANSALKWISTYCNGTKFIFKTDDDIFLDIFRLVKLLREEHWTKKRYFLGNVYHKGKMPILRDPKSCLRWCVKQSEMSGKWYPTYLAGGFQVISGDLIPDLYLASKTTPFFWVDDVYLSGLLPMKLQGVSYLSFNSLFTLSQNEFEKSNFDPNKTKKYIVTLTDKPIQFWLNTLILLPEEDKNILGNNYYLQLLKEAHELASNESQN